MDALVIRVSSSRGVIADFGPFSDEKAATLFLKSKGWTKVKGGKRSFLLPSDGKYEELYGNFRRVFHLKSPEELPTNN